MIEYIVFFSITLIVSTSFGVIGLGSSLVLIPIFTLLGLDFNAAKSMGLFINGMTTLSITLNNIKSKLINIKKISFLIVVSAVFAFFGAYSSNYIDESTVKIIFTLFMILSIVLLYMGFSKNLKEGKEYNKLTLIGFVSVVAFIGGLIGVGGGAVYLPLLIYIGIKTKNSIAITSALIPIVSFSAFFTYVSFVSIDFILLGVVTVAAIIGGHFGTIIMGKISNDKYLKAFILSMLIAILSYMIYQQMMGS